MSNDKRGQDCIKSKKVSYVDKRDIKSIQPGLNDQAFKKDSTGVDKKPGFNYQEKKKYTNKKLPEPH